MSADIRASDRSLLSSFYQLIRLLVRICACPEFFDAAAKLTVWQGSSRGLPPQVLHGRAV